LALLGQLGDEFVQLVNDLTLGLPRFGNSAGPGQQRLGLLHSLPRANERQWARWRAKVVAEIVEPRRRQGRFCRFELLC
jgi:hypothetical protein